MSKSNDLKILRHSAAHLLAHAVTELHPKTLLTIGPPTAEGFFYDFLPEHNFKESDLGPIAQRMQEIVARNIPLEHKEIPKAQAREIFKNNPYKLELIDQIPGETVGLATQGNFYDLCRGGHVATTGLLKNFKLLHISGSYWRADRNNQPLQRISGTAFATADDLAAYEQRQEELAQYDHRVIGKQMDLFSFHDEGVGFPFFHPKGQTIINTMKRYIKNLQVAHDYQEISTPTMLSDSLWKRSGHYAHYHDKMYFSQVDEQSYAIKPMNCPGAILTYQTRPRSYRELPLKLSEFGHVHRHELSGVLHGLMRVRAFTQDDAHIFCTLDQVEQEISTIVNMIYTMLQKFGFTKINLAIATRPENSIGAPGSKTSGSDEFWDLAMTALKNALNASGHTYAIKEGEGAFYGPKIDIDIEDSMGRHWQCGTVQVDPFQPENFDLHYIAASGKKERPVIIHQAIYGSLERFFAIVLEHYKGNLPFWLAPVQARVLTITDEQKEYGRTVYELLKKAGIRAEIDLSSDPLSGQIKNAQQEKIPLMLIVGNKEVAQQQVTLRHRDGKQEQGVSLDALAPKLTGLNQL